MAATRDARSAVPRVAGDDVTVPQAVPPLPLPASFSGARSPLPEEVPQWVTALAGRAWRAPGGPEARPPNAFLSLRPDHASFKTSVDEKANPRVEEDRARGPGQRQAPRSASPAARASSYCQEREPRAPLEACAAASCPHRHLSACLSASPQQSPGSKFNLQGPCPQGRRCPLCGMRIDAVTTVPSAKVLGLPCPRGGHSLPHMAAAVPT